jgi:hypothetical protein
MEEDRAVCLKRQDSVYHAMILSTVVVSIVGMAATLFVLAALSRSLLGVSLGTGQLMRALAYAQGAPVLGFIPIPGTLIRRWTIPSSIAAVREISGVETAKAVVFMIVGALVTVAANGAAFAHSDALAAELPIMRRSLV